MRFFIFSVMTFVMVSTLVACVPRAATTTTKTTTAHSSSYQDSFSLDQCEEIGSIDIRKRCFVDVLVLSTERVRELKQTGLSSDQLRYWYYVKDDASARLAALEEVTPSTWNVKKADIIMDIYVCEICPSVKTFVRGADRPEDMPPGWSLTLIEEGCNAWLQLEYEGVPVGPQMKDPFTHYEVYIKDDGTVKIYIINGEAVPCGLPQIT